MNSLKKAISICLSAAVISGGTIIPVKATETSSVALSKDGVAFRFAIIGDSHVKNSTEDNLTHFKDAIATLNEVGSIDAVGLNGDIILYTSSVTETPYDLVNEALLEGNISNTAEGATPFIYAMGNHEFIQNDNNETTCAQAVEMFETKMGQPLNAHKEYNGFHVIASGGESYNCQWSAGNYNTDEKWIMDEIKAIEASEDYNPNEPIFLMLHHPIINSVLRGVTTIDRRYTTDFVEFLGERPNIVQLTAHTHYAAQYPQSICQDLGFTAFQTPLTGTAGNGRHQTSFIDVTTDNKVRIYKIDLTTNTYIGQPWEIDIPQGRDGFKYTDTVRAENTQAPVFADGAKVTVSDIGNYSVTVNYPTGTVEAANGQQDNLVRSHRITLTDKQSGEVKIVSSFGAGFGTIPQPTEQSNKIEELDSGTTYIVSVEPMSMFGVYGSAITTEFTTSGNKAEIITGDSCKLKYDTTLIGEITNTETGAVSYDSLKSSYSAVLIRKGDYYTYTLEVGQGQQIEESGMYKVTYNCGSVSDSTANIYVKWPEEESYQEMVSGTELTATGGYTQIKPQEADAYIHLREGTNVLKIYLSSISKTNDGVYMGMPTLSKVTSGGYIDYGINTSVYNAISKTDGTGTGSITSNISTSTYQTSSMLSFRQGNYVVLPVQVPYTAAYTIDLTAKSTKSITGNVFKAAYSTESIEAAKALTSYSVATASTALTSSWSNIRLADSVILEGGTTYYFKIAATSVGSNHISQLSNIRFTDNGEYSTNAELSSLSVSGGEFEFVPTTEEYTVYAPMTSDGKVTVEATPTISGVTVSGVGEVAVNYGLNKIPVTATSRNGKETKTYIIYLFIVDNRVSLGCTNAKMYVGTSTTPIDVSKLFNGTGVVKTNGAGNAGFGVNYTKTAYIDLDLGEEAYLRSFIWERTNQGHSVKGITVWGSNDPEFTTYELLGTTYDSVVDGPKSPSITHKVMTTALNTENAYRYIRINKPSGSNTTFYPVKMDFYGERTINYVSDNLTQTITVPSKYYAVGDKVIAATYDSEGRMTGVNFTDALNAASTQVSVTKQNADDTVKVMVWEDFESAEPRIVSVDLD